MYQGSHGDKGAEIADVILPGAAYTEKNGMFINLEGKLQNAYKASYPPGDAREDWIIFRDLAKLMNKSFEFKSSEQLRKSIINYLNQSNKNKTEKPKNIEFVEQDILVNPIDYYHTNPIARASKVMNECKQITKNFLFTGIEKAS